MKAGYVWDCSFGAPRLERYQLWEPLGEGAMGVVYRAEDRDLRRAVAVGDSAVRLLGQRL